MKRAHGDPHFLTLEDVLVLHEEQLRRYGGKAGVRDVGVLDAALAMPKATFDGEFLHRDLFEMAAAYAFHVAQGQPFFDGNKRTGLVSALVFLDLNGVEINDPKSELADAMLALATEKLTKNDLAKVLRRLKR